MKLDKSVLLFAFLIASGAASARIIDGKVVEGCTSNQIPVGAVTFTKSAEALPVVIVKGTPFAFSFDAADTGKGANQIELVDISGKKSIVISCPSEIDMSFLFKRANAETPEI